MSLALLINMIISLLLIWETSGETYNVFSLAYLNDCITGVVTLSNGTTVISTSSSSANIRSISKQGSVWQFQSFSDEMTPVGLYRNKNDDGYLYSPVCRSINVDTANENCQIMKLSIETGSSSLLPFSISNITGMGFDTQNNMFVSDGFKIFKSTPNNYETLQLFVGSTDPLILQQQQKPLDGKGTNAKFQYINSLVVDTNDNLYVADAGHVIRKITNDATVTTVAGFPSQPGVTDGINELARFSSPTGLDIDSSSNSGGDVLFVADSGTGKIRKITVTDQSRNFIVTTIAGDPERGDKDGIGTLARLWAPGKLAVDKFGNVLVTEQDVGGKWRIRKIVVCNYGFEFDYNYKVCKCSSNGLSGGVCKICAAGSALDQYETGKCQTCPAGTISSSPNELLCVACQNQDLKCVECPAATFKGESTLSDPNSPCTPCPLGHESSPDKQSCVQCAPGKYRPFAELSACIACPSNAECSISTFSCSPGYTLNLEKTGCIACPNGLFKGTVGNHSCIACGIGLEPNDNRSSCVPCKKNTMKPSDDYDACVECPEGGVCTPTTIICMAGFEPHGTRSFSCQRCLDGYFKGVDGNFKCSKCGDTKYSNDDFTACVSCKRGFYQDGEDCLRCDIGSQPSIDRESCKPCPTGYFKISEDMDECSQCPVGAKCTSSSFTCEEGFTKKPNSNECMECPLGYYKSTKGNDACLQCPIGTQSVLNRQKCEDCPANYYRPSINYETCIPCPASDPTCSTWKQRQQQFSSSLSLSAGPNSTGGQPLNNTPAITIAILAIVLTILLINVFVIIIRYYLFGRRAKLKALRMKERSKMEKPDTSNTNGTLAMSTSKLDSSKIGLFPASSVTRSESSKKLTSTGNNTSYITNHSVSTEYSQKSNITLKGQNGLAIPAFLLVEPGKDFVCRKQINKGGGGVIYIGRANTPDLTIYGTDVIVKEFTNAMSTKEAYDQFYQEVAVMYLLRDHKNIAKLLGFTEYPFTLVMKLYSHGNLYQFVLHSKLAKTRRMQVGFVQDIIRGMQFMAENGLAHCDLKSPNVLVDQEPPRIESGTPGRFFCVLTDFGISSIINDTPLTVKEFNTIHIVGASISYASPELLFTLISRRRGIDKSLVSYPHEYEAVSSDIYSFATIAYEIITRRRLWKPFN